MVKNSEYLKVIIPKSVLTQEHLSSKKHKKDRFVDLEGVATDDFDNLCDHITSIPESNKISWKNMVDGAPVSVPHILMNCFHNENIIVNEHGKPAINPETVNLASTCLHYMMKMMEKTNKKSTQEKVDLPSAAKQINNARNFKISKWQASSAIQQAMYETKRNNSKLFLDSDLENFKNALIRDATICTEEQEEYTDSDEQDESESESE